jgi:site-specific DNA-methyltransferase (adenine-specific)
MKAENGMTATPIEPIVLRSSRVTCTLYCGDCLDLLPIEADAVVSDPPYGIDHKVERTGKDGDRWHNRTLDRIEGDKLSFDPSPWMLFPRICLFGANHFADQLPASAGWIVWDKRRGGTHAPGFIASDCELAWCRPLGSVKIVSHLWAGLCRESEIGEHWHPMQKPVHVVAWAMEQIKVPDGATVLDPFMGSGTTGVACIRTGRNFIGVEKDEKYFKIAGERLRRELAQGRMF